MLSAPVAVSQGEGQDQRREQLLSGAVFTRTPPPPLGGQVPRLGSYHASRATPSHAVSSAMPEYVAEDGAIIQPPLQSAPRSLSSMVSVAGPAPASRRPVIVPLQPTILQQPRQVLPVSGGSHSSASRSAPTQVVRPADALRPAQREAVASKSPEAKLSSSGKQVSQPHILYVALTGLEFHRKLPAALQGAWYESVKCFASIHPAADERKVGELPADVPEATTHGEHAVSQRFPLLAGIESNTDSGPVARVHMLENLALKLPELPPYAVVYLWARRASLFNHETFLIGSSLMPLQDDSLRNADSVPLRVFDAGSWEDIADLHLSFDFAHAPGEIQLPVLEKVRATQVTVHWHPPLRNGGAPVMGYRVERISGNESESKVEMLEECHKETSYTFRELASQCTYKVRIAAVNDAGSGAMRVVEFSTAASPERKQSSREDEDTPSGEFSEESPDAKVNVFPMRV
mmetsp:Transcript_51408/g.95072  ORF Transcript_51408/g.95072 Transcript_51408/m.95072 type:complete len:461 (-) Transcript_51408:35-1417(-)